MIVDSSYSMSQSDGIRSAFDKAKDAAGQLIDSFAAGSKVAVWLNSDAVDPLIPEPTADLALARTTIAGATRTDRSTDVMPALRQAIALLHADPNPRKEIDFFTDGQASGWKQMSDIRQLLASASDVQTNIIFVPTPPGANLTVASLRPVGELMLINRSIRFAATINNTGSTDIHDARVTLRIDGGDPADEAVIPSIAAGESRTVWLFARLTSEGFHTVSASVPGDRLPADDTRTIAVRALTGVKVLLVDGNPAVHDRDSETFYLQRLFAVSGSAGDSDSAPVTATVIDPGALQQQSLDGYAAVVFVDVSSVVTRDIEAIKNYVQRGGGLIVFPGDLVQSAFYNEQLSQNAKLLPALFGEAKGKADANLRLLGLQGNKFTNPIAEIWNDPAAGSPAAVNVFRYTPMTADASAASGASGAAQVVLNFSDGTPAVMERTFGLGRVIQFAISAGATWDDLPLHPGVFVPLIFRSLSAIVARQDEALNIAAGSPFSYHPSAQLLNQEATFIRPGEAANAPHDVRPIQLVANEPTVTDEQTDIAGGYSMTFAEGNPVKFAVQSDPRESIVQSLGAEERHSLESVAHVVDLGPAASIGAMQNGGSGDAPHSELWPQCAVIVLLLATAEMACAWWFSRAK